MTKAGRKTEKREQYRPYLDWKAFAFMIVAATVFFAFRCFAVNAAGISDEGAKILLVVGIAFLGVGIVDAIVEAKMDLPFFYGKSQSAGFNANSYFMCAVGIACLADSLLRFVLYTAAVTVVVAAERYAVEEMRCRKKEKYIGLKGVAATDIDYKGKGNFGDQILKVRVTDKAIRKGESICITDIDGFNIVVKTRRDANKTEVQEEKPNKKWAV